MARFFIEATWQDDGVDVRLYRDEASDAVLGVHQRVARALRPEDDRAGRRRIGEFRVTERTRISPASVRSASLAWLAEHASMTGGDSFEMQIAGHADLRALARLEFAGVSCCSVGCLLLPAVFVGLPALLSVISVAVLRS
jgi:hypothetical protein